MNKTELTIYIDEYLKIKDFQDGSKNGVQVDTTKQEIKKIGYAVDASSYIFDSAIEEKIDLLLVHHGLFWGFDNVLTGLHYERVSKLIKNDIALYGVHLPLDANENVGNNIGIINAFVSFFDLNDYSIEKFGLYHGETIGYGVRFSQKIEISRLKDFCEKMRFIFDFYNFGNLSEISSFCVISGGGGEDINQAKEGGYDLYLTGEAAHHELSSAKDIGQSVILGGHYETETVGVRLLSDHLKEKFGMDIVFIDEKY
ncbi:MAG: Nif3-like dinuclear metal center hexameric protein [Candidatus Gracilibacteria bacterium]|nr:Nif3-like dinuclear metal center hexameric protein [Candidatus Gracilibacteria bacterium]